MDNRKLFDEVAGTYKREVIKNPMDNLDKQRLILDAFHSRQATQYIEMLRNLPEANRPKAGPDLVADYIEFIAMTGAENV